jgi:WXG100 family type VII secretion target
VIQANYDDLATIAGSFSQRAQAVEQLIQQMSQLEQALEGGGWTGLGAAAFFAEMGDLVFPAMHRLTGALNEAQTVVGRISTVFRDAEEEASRQFEDEGSGQTEGGGLFSSLFGGTTGSSTGGSLAQGTVADISKYQNGVNGWSMISMDGSKGFTANELVSQKGDTCAIYGPLNLLIASGYDIGQGGADAFANITKMQEAWWRPDMWFDENPNWGFKMGVSEDVIAKYTPNYKRGDFEDEPAKAERFLIDSARNGKPVMVTMEMDDSFGGSGAHTANVLGVQTGPDGRLKSVLVATNWAGKPVMEIPAATFMDDWMGHNDGAYMTVERKPPPPRQPGAGFSKDLLDELNKQGFPNPTMPPPPSNAPRR